MIVEKQRIKREVEMEERKMIKKSFRFVALTAAVAISASLFAGCGNKAETPQNNTQAGQGEIKPAKLTWWSMARHDMEYIKGLVEKFNKENKYGITVDYQIQSENFRQSLDLAFQSNQAPDVFSGQDLAKYYVDKGQVEPLDKWLTSEMKSRYGNVLYTEGDNGVNGKIYSLPNAGVTYRLVYNKDLLAKAGFTEPPKSMDQLVTYAKKITEVGKADKVYGFAINLKNTQTAMERSVNVVGQKSGVTYFDYKTGKFNFNPYKPILTSLKKIVDDGSMFPGYESLDIDPLRSQFAQGKIGMYFGGSWEPGVYADQFKTEVNWAAAPVPTLDGTVKGPSFISGLRWMYISSKTQYKEQAWKVMEYFNTDTVQIPYQEKGYGNSVVPSVIKAAKKPEMKGMEYFVIGKEDAQWPTRPQERTLKIEGKPFNDVFAMVIMGKADFDKEVDGLNKKYNDALDAAIKDGTEKDWKKADFDPATLITK